MPQHDDNDTLLLIRHLHVMVPVWYPPITVWNHNYVDADEDDDDDDDDMRGKCHLRFLLPIVSNK